MMIYNIVTDFVIKSIC